jgi:hypothetical protein
MDVLGYVRRVDGAQRGRIRDLGSGCDPAGLADGDLVQQPDGQAGVAGAFARFGLGEHGCGIPRGVGGQGEPGLAGQGGEDGGELAGGVAGEVDDGRDNPVVCLSCWAARRRGRVGGRSLR